MNKQQIFDKAFMEIIDQGRPSISPDGDACLYAGPEHTACAVGKLIDRKTAELWDAKAPQGVKSVHDKGLLEGTKYAWMIDQVSFLSEVQNCHDNAAMGRNSAFVKEYSNRMKEVARLHDLTVPDYGEVLDASA